MTDHPKKKDLINAALSNSDHKGGRERYVLEHINGCELCAKKYNAIISMLQPSDNSNLHPSDQLESKILRSYRLLQNDKKSESLFSSDSINKFLKPVAYYAAAVIIIFSAIFYLSDKTDDDYAAFRLSYKSIAGISKINDSIPEKNLIEQNSTINVMPDSRAEIYHKNLFSIRLAGDTVFNVDDCKQNTNLNAYRLNFSLADGKLNASFLHGGPALNYTFNTPHAVIKSIGTEFSLQVVNEETRLILMNGKVKIQSNYSGEEITASKGKKYVVPESGKITETEHTGKKLFKKSRLQSKKRGSPVEIKKDRKINLKKHAAGKSQMERAIRKELRKEKKVLRKEMKKNRKEMKKIRKSSRKEF